MVPFALHAVANTPAGLMELVRSYRSTNFGLPTNRGGSAPALSVSGPAQRLHTLRPARSPSRLATLCTRGFSSFVASTAALIATGWSEPVPGRVYSRCGPPPFTAHPVIRRAPDGLRGDVCIVDFLAYQDYSSRTRRAPGQNQYSFKPSPGPGKIKLAQATPNAGNLRSLPLPSLPSPNESFGGVNVAYTNRPVFIQR
jgi:hypothetical protein